MTDNFDGLRIVFQAELQDQNLVITPQTVLADIPGWDSVNLSCVILGVETRFGVTFTADQMDRLETVDDFLTVIGTNAEG
jgi:acyl carrier protein